MHQNVIVSFGSDKRFEYKLTAEDLTGYTGEQAGKWFEREFQELECDVPTAMGKVLLADRILSVAKYSGEQRFRDHPEWAEQLAPPLPVASEVAIEIELPVPGVEPLQARARVFHCFNAGAVTGEGANLLSGMGVAYDEPGVVRAAIGAALERGSEPAP